MLSLKNSWEEGYVGIPEDLKINKKAIRTHSLYLLFLSFFLSILFYFLFFFPFYFNCLISADCLSTSDPSSHRYIAVHSTHDGGTHHR